MEKRTFLAKGKRGVVYTDFRKGRKIAIKTANPASKAIGRIKNEAHHLKILNRYSIGPKLISYDKNELKTEFIEGVFILDFMEKNNEKEVKKIIKKVFDQVYALDGLGIDKEEMHRPLKHIIITRQNKPVLIDFERCHASKKPKNVTQWCQFLMSRQKQLDERGIRINKREIISLAKRYKKKPTKAGLNAIIRAIK